MGNYKEYIPTSAFVVKPDYEVKSAVVDGFTYSRSYFTPLSISTYRYSFEQNKYPIFPKTEVTNTTTEYDASVSYTKESRVCINDFGVIYEAGTDVPAGNNPLDPNSVDESGVPYWVEADTIDPLKLFDVSTATEFKISGKGLKITTGIVQYLLPLYSKVEQQVEHISILGIKGSGDKTRAYVQIYHADIMGLVNEFVNPTNQCNYYNAAIIDTFEIDLYYRDRISFAVPNMATTTRPPLPEIDHTNGDEDTNVLLVNGVDIAIDIFIESRSVPFLPGFSQTPCGGAALDTLSDLSIGLVTTGKRSEIGSTEFGMSLGRVTKRGNETNYLKRRTVVSATESFDCKLMVESPEEHLKADYFFRVASETSHIIHAGVPDFDWRFVFGVLDGNSPIDNPNMNSLQVSGYGAAFFATDQLITQVAPQGWS